MGLTVDAMEHLRDELIGLVIFYESMSLDMLRKSRIFDSDTSESQLLDLMAHEYAVCVQRLRGLLDRNVEEWKGRYFEIREEHAEAIDMNSIFDDVSPEERRER